MGRGGNEDPILWPRPVPLPSLISSACRRHFEENVGKKWVSIPPKSQEEIIITLLRCFPRPDRGMAHIPLHLIGVALIWGRRAIDFWYGLLSARCLATTSEAQFDNFGLDNVLKSYLGQSGWDGLWACGISSGPQSFFPLEIKG